MNAPVTRRALLGATAAVGAAILTAVAVAEAVIPVSELDANLFDLILRHAEAWDACERAEAETDRIATLARAVEPSRPETMRYREGDFPRTLLGHGLSEREGHDVRWYGGKAAGWMRDRAASTWFPSLVTTLGAECEERRVEILIAWDAWRTDVARVEAAMGLPSAEEACAIAATAFWSVDEALLARQPVTLDGLRAKAAWVLAYAGRDGLDTEAVAVTLARQVAAFGGGRCDGRPFSSPRRRQARP